MRFPAFKAQFGLQVLSLSLRQSVEKKMSHGEDIVEVSASLQRTLLRFSKDLTAVVMTEKDVVHSSYAEISSLNMWHKVFLVLHCSGVLMVFKAPEVTQFCLSSYRKAPPNMEDLFRSKPEAKLELGFFALVKHTKISGLRDSAPWMHPSNGRQYSFELKVFRSLILNCKMNQDKWGTSKIFAVESASERENWLSNIEKFVQQVSLTNVE